jgi:hypothetical protein
VEGLPVRLSIVEVLDIADRAGVPFAIIREAAREPRSHNLLAESPRPETES